MLTIISCNRHVAPKGEAARHDPTTLTVDGKLWASVYQQRAGEYKALCLQAFNLATLRVDLAMTTGNTARPKAIITDIDETFMDNSPYAIQQSLQGKDYEPASWTAWTARGMADTLPGALQFFQHAASKGIEVFYITNREEKERAGTLQNLRRFNFPFTDDAHLVMRNGPSSKEIRRQQVAMNFDILLLLGDNLADFNALFDKKTETERNANVELLRQSFGDKFIVLPNVTYGGWEEAIYEGQYNRSAGRKDSLLRAGLKIP